MENITSSATITDITNKDKKEMPSVGEFVSAKLGDAFSTLGDNFGKGKKKVSIKKEIIDANLDLDRKAKAIGCFVLEEIKNGNRNIYIPQEYIFEIEKTLSKINSLKDEYNNI